MVGNTPPFSYTMIAVLSNVSVSANVFIYVAKIQQADELNSKIGAKNFLLIQKMRDFVKDSIQL